MARRPNYGAEKRSKELNKQRKREEKEEKKRARRESGGGLPDETRDGELDAAAMTPSGAADGEDLAGDEDDE